MRRNARFNSTRTNRNQNQTRIHAKYRSIKREEERPEAIHQRKDHDRFVFAPPNVRNDRAKERHEIDPRKKLMVNFSRLELVQWRGISLPIDQVLRHVNDENG